MSYTKKIAVVLAGPSRYINSTIKRIEFIKNKKLIDYYIFLWAGDLGNKQREMEEEFDEGFLKSLSIVFYSKATPFTEESYNSYFTEETEERQSIVSNIMGMFQSMRILATHLDASTTKYDYVLRLRTDCILISDDVFNENFSCENKTHISMNYLIPYAWASDHIMLANKRDFIRIWSWSSSEELYSEYQKAGMNPEKLLSRKLKKLNIKPVYSWLRYLDYQVVYFPLKVDEPQCVNDYLMKYGVENFYNKADEYLISNRNSILEHLAPQKKNQDYFAKPKIVKAYLRLKVIWSRLFKT
jgi:hypothetical protein